jgi:RNA polymerase sigma factor (sigma-70 family)
MAARTAMYIPRSDSPEDAELLDLYRQSGDPEYLGKLYGRYMHLVYGVCLKYLGDRERCKDAVLRIYEKLGAELLRHEVLNFRPWLHVLVRNHCLMELRADKTQDRHLREYAAEQQIFMESSDPLHPTGEEQLDRDLEALRRCIEELKEKQKKCVALFYLEEKSYREIVDITGMDLMAVKSNIQNGKRNLKICLEENRAHQEKP